MSFPRYPKYKPSGVEWLGDVPTGWAITRLKRTSTPMPSNVDKKSHEGEAQVRLCNYTDVYYNDFITNELDFMIATASDDQIEKFTLQAGDTIITKDSETADDIAVAAYVPKDLPGVVCGYHLSIVRPVVGTCGAFLKWWFASQFAKSCFAIRANGLTRVGLGQHELENVDLAMPPLPEQRAIASFLDRETAKIDALVAEQQRLIELLKEKRQAVISHAVTKGLDPKAPMKCSDVPGLETVPAHWDLKPLKHILVVENAGCYGVEAAVGELVLPVATTAQIDPDGHFRVEEMPLRGFSTTEAARFGCRPGDVLVVKSSGSATNIISGKAGYVDEATRSFVFSNFLMRLRAADPSDSTRYFYWIIRSHLTRQRVEQMCATTTYPNLRVGEYVSSPVPVPPQIERDAISNFVAKHEIESRQLIAEVQRAITLLQERRSALISAAVTGQIDVRNTVTSEAA